MARFDNQAIRIAGRVFHALLPSFIADLVYPDHKPTYRLHPTSYLDGLRGIASFIVFFCHYTEENHKYMIPSYGLNPKGQVSSWLQLPFLRIVFSGRPMVHIFFVISGFVLSHKPLKLLHAKNLEKSAGAVASSAFRRPFRLYGPCIVSTFIIAILIQMGYIYKPVETFGEQLWNWKDAVFHSITWPWAWDLDLRPGYDVHLWTIPIEMAHSMLLFLVLITLSMVRLRLRQFINFALMIYCLCCGKWAGFEFLGGMFLAEIRLLQASGDGEWWVELQKRHRILSILRSVFWSGVIMVFVFIGGWPNFDADKTPGIRYLNAHTPYPFATMDPLAPQKYWFALSAIFAVYACGELAWIRRFLDSSLGQYCGRLSYAIYIVHGPVLEMFQKMTMGQPFTPQKGNPGEKEFVPAKLGKGIKGMIGVEGPTQRFACWAAGLLILFPIVVWFSDIFWRLVDAPMVELARKVEKLCVDEEIEPNKRREHEQRYQMVGV
ncbi:uncharacterized protein PpBr36_05610 [Pyricularia pennisetigena]|uniref:uncharacterized protein n=1 Tax=Pyricularia pennisetigena TaxID=1578925 RepID=UPI00115076CE|nr:uncharacterized protein PpBr36_05610 [Pyricularia pennisetigena]TLS22943.1 hypothetical protein PpBr36_05610 [Pyricularia pennisetigena]